jgi:2-polyprenyl-6-methoxyphenol hydroxylase-like FAD-dependent oxidoreductase
MELPVIIVGAGLGGLALAQGLKKRGIPYLVFERDAGSDIRSQGLIISVNQLGILALRHLMGKDEADQMLCRCSVSARKAETTNPEHSVLKTINPKTMDARFTATSLCTVNRTALRLALLEDIEVQWGKQFSSYQENANSVTVTFADGFSVEGRILVGADGKYSKVRQQRLPDVKLVEIDEKTISLPFCIEDDLFERVMLSSDLVLFSNGRYMNSHLAMVLARPD